MDSIWYEILVIILASFLGVFLILGILVLIKILKILETAKKISEHAENMAERADNITAMFEKTAGPVALVKMLSNLSDSLLKKGKKDA